MKIILGLSAIALCSLSVFFLKPEVAGDSISYVESMQVIESGILPPNFSANRIITTFGGLELVIFLSKVFGSTEGAWLLMNAVFYTILVFAFYKILELLFQSSKISLLGTVLLASNYALLQFGLAYLMDVGGWMFYILSLLSLLRYVQSQNRKDLLIASGFVGVGGLFKEYAFLAIIPVAFFLVYENLFQKKSLWHLIKNSLVPSLLTIVPILLVYLYAYLKFHYTYLNWLEANQEYYIYPSRIVEYIKSVGSLWNILGVFFLIGLWVLRQEWAVLEIRTKIFLCGIFFSVLPIFFWPAITQRLMFISVPFVVIISCFFFKKYERFYYVFIFFLALYILGSFFMDSFILPHVNLPL